MDASMLYQAIFKRKSVRKLDNAPLDQRTLDLVTSQFPKLVPMVKDIRTELKLMTSDEVRGMFKVDAPHFLAIFSEKKDGYLLNAGFIMQQMDLFLSANGIGSCWQGGPKPTRGARGFMGLEFVVLLAFGKPQEKVHREGLAEFKRKPIPEITDISGRDDLLEPARLAPSGMNNQPWFFTDGNGRIYAHYHKSLIADHMNQISLGIAISHLWIASQHLKLNPQVSIEPSSVQEGHRRYAYAASITIA